MADRLAEIKAKWNGPLGMWSAADSEWLLAEVKQLRAELDKAWQAALDQGTENTQLRLAMIGASDALRAAAHDKPEADANNAAFRDGGYAKETT